MIKMGIKTLKIALFWQCLSSIYFILFLLLLISQKTPFLISRMIYFIHFILCIQFFMSAQDLSYEILFEKQISLNITCNILFFQWRFDTIFFFTVITWTCFFQPSCKGWFSVFLWYMESFTSFSCIHNQNLWTMELPNLYDIILL